MHFRHAHPEFSTRARFGMHLYYNLIRCIERMRAPYLFDAFMLWIYTKTSIKRVLRFFVVALMHLLQRATTALVI